MLNKQKKQPVLRIPLSRMEIILEIAAIVGILFGTFIVVQAWPTLPDRIPIHFGASGMPDGWGSKETIFLLPIVGIGLYIMMTVLSRYPHTYSYLWAITEQNAERQYRLARSLFCWIKLEIVWLFAFLDWETIQVFLGKMEGLGEAFLPVTLVVIFGTTAFYFFQAYRAR